MQLDLLLPVPLLRCQAVIISLYLPHMGVLHHHCYGHPNLGGTPSPRGTHPRPWSIRHIGTRLQVSTRMLLR